MVAYLNTYRIVEDYEKGIEYDFKKTILRKQDIPAILTLLLIVMLISGKFRFQLLSIGSGSMAPAIDKGDAVFLDRNPNKNKLKKDDIVAYMSNDKLIIHRIVEIKKDHGKRKYKLKGDANNTADNVLLSDKDVVGLVKFKIKYIGYPSVFISEQK